MSIYISYLKRPNDDPITFSSAIENFMSRYRTWHCTSSDVISHPRGQLIVETYEVHP